MQTHIMNRLIVGCFSSVFVLFSSVAANEISVTQYGAWPNDGKDDTAALRRAVAACEEGEGKNRFCISYTLGGIKISACYMLSVFLHPFSSL